MRRMVRVKCGHDGCSEYAHYEADNRADVIRIDSTYGNGKWRCVRHRQPNEVLSAENPETVFTMQVFEEPHGKYWGVNKSSNGFVYGPGFKGFAEDFPAGTIIEVTAKITLPK